MIASNTRADIPAPRIVPAEGETPLFDPGDQVRISDRSPVGHYRVPIYLRGRPAVVDTVIAPAGLNNEEEAFGRNAGGKRHYYRVAVRMADIWPDYAGACGDSLRVEIFETWLERI